MREKHKNCHVVLVTWQVDVGIWGSQKALWFFEFIRKSPTQQGGLWIMVQHMHNIGMKAIKTTIVIVPQYVSLTCDKVISQLTTN
jgi:hypothetical protein